MSVSNLSVLPFLGLASSAPYRLIDQEFGMAFNTGDMFTFAPNTPREYYRPWRHMAVTARDFGSTIVDSKDKFQVNLDVQHFAPENISVKTVDGYLVIEGQHDEKKDEQGFISRQFTRRYCLPTNCDPNTVESKLSSDGVLTVIAPRMDAQPKNERNVPITQTGPIRKEYKEGTVQQISQTDGDANGTDK